MLALVVTLSCHAPWHCAQNAENPTLFVLPSTAAFIAFPPNVMAVVEATVLYEFCEPAFLHTGQTFKATAGFVPPVAEPPTPPTYDCLRYLLLALQYP